VSLEAAIMRAARNLRIPIPQPYIPPPKEQQSFAQLKPRQNLRSIVEISVAGKLVPRGSVWKVASCWSDGAVLEHDAGGFILTFRQGDANWKGRFERVKGRGKK
jgi:hypothetical protein